MAAEVDAFVGVEEGVIMAKEVEGDPYKAWRATTAHCTCDALDNGRCIFCHKHPRTSFSCEVDRRGRRRRQQWSSRQRAT